MKLIKQSFEILTKINRSEILQSIEKAGRTCYKSESNITDESASKFVKSIVERGHESVIEHINISVKIICDRGVSHEIVRHRLASYSQESTRYVNYEKKGLTFILPLWITDPCITVGEYETLPSWEVPFTADQLWISFMIEVEGLYIALIDRGWKPEQARSVLPNSLKTEIIMTCNLRNWKHIFELRCSEKAHPQMRELMIPLQKEFQKLLPEVFGELNETK